MRQHPNRGYPFAAPRQASPHHPRGVGTLSLASGGLGSIGGRRAGRQGSTSRLRSHLTPLAFAVSLIGLGVLMVTQQSLVRGLEARSGADIARGLGLVPARAVGSAVVFPLRGRFVGYAVTEGCTAAFLVAPFFVVAALLIASRRTPPHRGVGALSVLTAVFFLVNQVRIFVVAASMRVWGFRPGYERSHVFLGTMLSTVGAVVGVLAFVWLVIDHRSPGDEPGDRWADAG